MGCVPGGDGQYQEAQKKERKGIKGEIEKESWREGRSSEKKRVV